jgi:hypothetical protein
MNAIEVRMKYLLMALLTLPFIATAQQAQDTDQDEVQAEAPNRSVSSVSDEQVQERAKRRQYAGGQDESDLKVQVQVATPTRKVAPTTEEPAEPAAHDND